MLQSPPSPSPQAIILDDPHLGGPVCTIWDFLLCDREGRAIMLSTHHMDKAEMLSRTDRDNHTPYSNLRCYYRTLTKVRPWALHLILS